MSWLVLLLLVVAFAAFSLDLVFEVDALRGQLARNVSTLMAVQDLGEGPEVVQELEALQAAVEGTELERPVSLVADAIDGPDREMVVRAFTAEVRRKNARLSQELGTAWDRSALVIFSALGFALTALVLGAVAVYVQATNTELQRALTRQQATLETADVLRSLNAELAVARDEALATQRMKSRLLGVLGHELRTPLNAILGYAELIAEADPTHTAPIIAATRRLTRRVQQILDLSEDVSVPLPRQTVALEALIAPLADKHGATLHGSATLKTQPNRLSRVLDEVLANAAHYGERVQVILSLEGDWVNIEVVDDGRGMAAETVRRATEPFWQADMSPTRTKEGLGLGLAVAKHHVRRLGGALDIVSAPDMGTTVTLRLPR